MTSRRDRRSSRGEVLLGMVLKVGGVHTGSCGEVRTAFQVKAQRWDSERPGREAGWVHMADALGARKKSPQFMRQHGALAKFVIRLGGEAVIGSQSAFRRDCTATFWTGSHDGQLRRWK